MVRSSATAFLLALVSWGCIAGTPDDDCPEVEPLRLFRSGTFASEGGSPKDWHCEEGCGVVFPPHDGATDLKMDIALADGTVTVRYLRDGKRIEERWRITGRY